VYIFDVGEKGINSVCPCCGKPSCTGHGFIYKDGDAYAVYYVGWSVSHSEKKVSFALAIGEWGDDSTSEDRNCFGLEAYDEVDEIQFRVVDPDESPWPRTDLLGDMLTREEALRHPLIKEVFLLAEEIIRNHSAVREYLGALAA
jgi:hypothetical protein